jgi:predicted tellurium resistance membrane protein TerC
VEWLSDPQIWASLLTLTALEIVLGIDNLVFIAILAGRLPAERQDRARQVGLALITRLALLASIVWIIGLTQPLCEVLGHVVSWRDVILIAGGFFLLYKDTREIHDRLDGDAPHERASIARASFGGVVVQIILLDNVFSLDSVITAVGMANDLWVMAAAIIIAVLIMLGAFGPLATFVDPTSDGEDAGAELPAADRHDVGGRRRRLSRAQRVHLRRDQFLGRRRALEPARRAAAPDPPRRQVSER